MSTSRAAGWPGTAEHEGVEMTVGDDASRYLDALLDERSPDSEPSDTREWADAFLEAFRRFRDNQRGREAEQAARRLGMSAAADPFRFFWEFWQNADDAGATELEFAVSDTALTIRNNGRSFTPVEVFSLLMVGGTTKDDRLDQMGQFGVGSLSLMRYSDAPTYRTGQFAFTLERSFTYPAVPARTVRSIGQGLAVEAPLRAGVSPDTLFDQLASRLADEALLYMAHLRRVVVRRGRRAVRVIEANPTTAGPGSQVKVGDRTWNRYDLDVAPPQDLLRDDGKSPSSSVRITLVRDPRHAEGASPVHVYFPTQLMHEYPWRFSAPFDVTTGRESLLDGAYNRWLLREVGRAMVTAAADRTVGMPSTPWELVPREEPSTELLTEVWRGALDEMRRARWLPAGRTRIRASDAAFAVTDEVRALLSASDLLTAAGSRRRWLPRTPPPPNRHALIEAGAFMATPLTLAKALSRGPRNRPPAWYLESLAVCVDAAGTDDEVVETLVSGRSFLNRRGTPVSLAEAQQKGKVVCNARSEVLSHELAGLFSESLIVLLHRVYRLADRKTDEQVDVWRRQVDVWLRNTASEDTFTYESRLDAATFIRLFVVEQEMASGGGDVADRLLSFVRDHLDAYVSLIGPRNRVTTTRQLGQVLRVRASRAVPSGKREIAYVPVADVALPAGFLDGSPWPDAARGTPGIWWADSRYRVGLARKGNPLGATGFLRELGAVDGPRVVSIPEDAWHGNYQFTRVTRTDVTNAPNFPHAKVKFGQYSDYGLDGDSDSTDLAAVLSHLATVPRAERVRRGEALLRTIEGLWAKGLDNLATAHAYGYYWNSAYDLGVVDARWVSRLKSSPWVALQTGEFVAPSDAYARTPVAASLLAAGSEPLCAWDTRDVGVARRLGFRVEIEPAVALRYLRDARSGVKRLRLDTVKAFYAHLTRVTMTPELAASFDEGLVYSPRSREAWTRPALCLQHDRRDVFGTLIGYVDPYPDAHELWTALDIPEEPDLAFLARVWTHFGNSFEPSDSDLHFVLARSYALAETLLKSGSGAQPDVPVVAGGSWLTPNVVFATQVDELAAELTSAGMVRWDLGAPELVPRVADWLGVLDVDRVADVRVIADTSSPAPDIEGRVHRAIARCAAEVRITNVQLWTKVAKRFSDVLRGRVVACNPLRLRVAIDNELLGKKVFEVAASARLDAGNLYLSTLTRLADKAVVGALLSGLPLDTDERWSLSNALQLHLLSDSADVQALPEVELGGWMPEDDDGDFDGSGTADGTGTGEQKPSPASRPKAKSKPKKSESQEEPAPPVDSYAVQSDVGGDGVGTGQGGLVPRGQAKNVPPGKGGGGGGGGGGGPDRHSRRDTEQRGVDLFRAHVLDPAGVTIKDVRLRRGVGADLVGDDNVFRELKTHSGAAPAELGLTEHEYVRAGNTGQQYELVVVEDVWGEPIITIVNNPLHRLKYSPAGGVVVKNWRDNAHDPRVVTLVRAGQDAAEGSGPATEDHEASKVRETVQGQRAGTRSRRSGV
jgi:hypothetical protein